MKNGETPDPNVIHPIAGDTLESMALEIIARAAAIIETDCGKMVYKPRNCLADVRTRIFAKKYFPGSVLIPKCYTDGSSFGVCEYLTADPERETADPGKWFLV